METLQHTWPCVEFVDTFIIAIRRRIYLYSVHLFIVTVYDLMHILGGAFRPQRNFFLHRGKTVLQNSKIY
jgi:hypothetical protein